MASHDEAEGGRMHGFLHEPNRRPLDSRVQTEIGKHLRAVYDDVINEPVPDRFMELLIQLEQSSRHKR